MILDSKIMFSSMQNLISQLIKNVGLVLLM